MSLLNNKKYPYKGEDLLGISEILIAEYNVLRKEIDLCHEHQKEIMNFLFLVFIAMVSLLGFLITTEMSNIVSIIFLIFPLIFSLLSLIYTDRTVHILRLADYIHNVLRKKINKICGEKVWQWETYKKHTPPFTKKLTLILDKSRWLIFLFPSIISIIFFFVLMYNEILTYLYFALPLIIFDFIISSFSIYSMLGVEETTGIENREIENLDDFE